jgi:hypothetical protein
MNRSTAEKVLEEVREQFDTDEPMLYDADHEELSEGSWSIAWEAGNDWPHFFRCTVPGVFVEPIASWCLGVYDA